MKKTPLKRIGKVGEANLKANRILARRWKELGVVSCEICLPGCTVTWPLQNVHRHKRAFYRGNYVLLSAYEQVVRGCQSCHETIENDAEITEFVFARLRGEDPLT